MEKRKVITPEFWMDSFPDKPWHLMLFEEKDSNLTLDKTVGVGECLLVVEASESWVRVQTEDGIHGWLKPHVLEGSTEKV